MTVPDGTVGPVDPDETVRAGLDASLRRAVLLGLVVWQGVMVVVLVLMDAPHGGVLLMLHAVLAALAWTATHRSRWLAPTVLLAFVVWFLDYRAADSLDDAITLAACWLGNLLYGIGALTLRGAWRAVVPIGGALAVGISMLLVDPLWDPLTASSITVTAVAIVVAAHFFLPSLWSLADDVDRSSALLAEQDAEQEAGRRAADAAAEDARVVHDTVINTLAAVASGWRDGIGAGLVRERCHRDAEVVEELLRGRRREAPATLAALGDDAGLEVRRRGLVGEDLRRAESLLPEGTLAALVAATGEVVRNAARHADVDHVDVETTLEPEHLVVTVTDTGRGFDPGATTSRGLRHSVEERLAAVDGTSVVTSRPGGGTTVVLRVPSSVEEVADLPDPDADERAASDAVLRRSLWLWSAGVVTVGVVIEAANRPGRLTLTYAMLALVTACVVAAWWDARRRGRLSAPVQAVVVVAAPAGYLLSMASIGFGTDQVLTYQAIGISPLGAALLVLGTRRALRTSVVLLGLTGLATAVVLSTSDVALGAVALAAVAPSLGMVAGWRAFARLVRDLAPRAARNRALSARSMIESRARREVVTARRRWSTVGLERSAALLRRLGEEPEAVGDPGVRAEAAREEQHLRQLLLLDPTSYRMTTWFAHALARARSVGVELVVRSGDVDAPDPGSARTLGSLVLDAVESSRPGDRVTVGFFPGDQGPRLVLVVPASGAISDVDDPAWSVTTSRAGGHAVVEVRPAGELSAPSPA